MIFGLGGYTVLIVNCMFQEARVCLCLTLISPTGVSACKDAKTVGQGIGEAPHHSSSQCHPYNCVG